MNEIIVAFDCPVSSDSEETKRYIAMRIYKELKVMHRRGVLEPDFQPDGSFIIKTLDGFPLDEEDRTIMRIENEFSTWLEQALRRAFGNGE